MRSFTIPHKKGLLCAAISLSLLPLTQSALAQTDPAIEEVVITGSFIRRSEGFTQASSVTQLTAEDLAAEGTLNFAEVIQNLAFVNGSASAITNTIQGTDSASSSVDLRGLGASSTLTLVDGKRVVNDNVNALLPSIAIQRLDIVADGAAALYGSEAVAGVVNFVPYKSYDGFKVELFSEGDTRGDFTDDGVQFLWGGPISDDVDVVVAGSFRNTGRLEWAERPILNQSGLTFSSFSNPGTFTVPLRDENGLLTTETDRAPDPNCGEERDFIQPGVAASPFGFRDGDICRFEFGDTRNFRDPTETAQFYGNFNWDQSENLTVSSQFFFTRLTEVTHTSTSNPGGSRVPELPIVRGEIPGNSFRAMDAFGNPLFARDANGDAIPDRGNVDLNNDGLMDAVLAANPTDPSSGVPLFEDVSVLRIRPIGKANTLPDGTTPDGDNTADSDDQNLRASIQADFKIPFAPEWEGMAAFTHSFREIDFMSNQNFDISAMIQGLNCDVVNDRDACYSPFAIVDPADLTSINVVNAIAGRQREQVEDTLQTWDLVFNGTIPGFELPGGPVGLAVGYQHRVSDFEETPSAVEIAGNAFIGTPENEVVFGDERHVDAFFIEAAVPLLNNLELELAVRDEDFSTGQGSTDPKFGITWAATNWITLRATTGDAFIAPSLRQLNAPETCGLSNADDPFGPFSGFVTACSGGNPNLKNESSESDSFGIDITPIDNLRFSVTYNETEFEQRIISLTAAQILDIDFFNFRQATGFTGDGETIKPSTEQLIAWNNNPARDPRIIRDPNDVNAILQINTGSSNAESVKVEALDIQGDYNFSAGRIGDFRFNLQATFIDSFTFRQTPDSPLVEAAGRQNFTAGGTAPALPEWKANLRIGWNRGRHSATTTVRYIDDVTFDGPQNTVLDRFANTFRVPTTEIHAWTDVDLAYSYRGLGFLGGEGSFTLGLRNATDREAQRTPMFAGVIGELQDPLGRVLYGRVSYEF